MLRFVGIALLITSVALVAFDAAIYFKSGGQFVLTSTEKLWTLLGGQHLFNVRSTLASAFGPSGDTLVDLPAVALTFLLGLLLAWVGQKATRRED